MACRVEMSTQPDKMIAYWKSEEGYTHSEILASDLTYEEARERKAQEAYERRCLSGPSVEFVFGRVWSVYHVWDDEGREGNRRRGERQTVQNVDNSLSKFLEGKSFWLSLGTILTVYFSTLAKHAANSTWNWLQPSLKGDDIKSLRDLAGLLEKAAKSVEGANNKITVELDVSVGVGGSTLLDTKSVQELLKKIAFAILHVEGGEEALKKAMSEGRIRRSVTFELQSDGSLLMHWQTPDGNQKEVRMFPRGG